MRKPINQKPASIFTKRIVAKPVVKQKPVVHKREIISNTIKRSMNIQAAKQPIQRPLLPSRNVVRQKNPPLNRIIRKNVPQKTVLGKTYQKQEIKPGYRTQLHNQIYASEDKIRELKNVGQGKILVIIACGPSVLEVPLEKIIGHPKIDFMTINKPYGAGNGPEKHRPLWPARWWAFCDHSQYKRNENVWNSYHGTIINSPAVRARKANQIIIRNKPGRGFSRDLLSGYHIGRSSTFANMQVALWMNYDKIYIFGLDMCEVPGKGLHHYGTNPDVAPENRKRRFSNEAEYYQYAANILTEYERKKFVICSSYNPFPFVKMYGYLDHKTAPDNILETANACK